MRKKKMLKGSTTFWTRIYKKYLRKLNFLLRKTDKSQWKTPLILAQETCKEFSPVDFQKFVYNLIDDIKTINV